MTTITITTATTTESCFVLRKAGWALRNPTAKAETTSSKFLPRQSGTNWRGFRNRESWSVRVRPQHPAADLVPLGAVR
jgi:hypothetical protein